MDVSDRSAEQRLVDGSAWNAFCASLQRAGDQILRSDAPASPFDKAEGYRYLLRLLRASLEKNIEFNDPSFPAFYRLSHETVKIGADNPDSLYQNARIDGRFDYRITGRRGTVSYIGFSTKAGNFAGGSMLPTGFVDTNTLQLNDDGTFDIFVSAREHPGNWLPMAPESEMLIVRQTFQDRRSEVPADISIVRVDRDARPEPLDPARFSSQLEDTVAFVEGTARLFADWAADFATHPNELSPQDQTRYQVAGGDPSIYYVHAYWELADDEALVIDVPPPPECDTWNLQVNNHWMESLDYRYHTIHVNKHTAVYNADRSVRIVLAHRDPGVPNWLETAGHHRGTLLFRWIGAEEHPMPVARRVKLTELDHSMKR
jgi:hypothetical protein